MVKLINNEQDRQDLFLHDLKRIEYQSARIALNPNFNDIETHSRQLIAAKGMDLMIAVIKFFNSALIYFSRSFSDYRIVKGIAVAFRQEERFEDQLMYSIQFTDVQFGAALADVDFSLPKR